MTLAIIPGIVYILLTIMWFLFIAQMICWFITMVVPPFNDHPINLFMRRTTDPIIGPFRAVLPTINGIDIFSFILAVVFLQLVRSMVGALAGMSFL